MAAAAPEGDEPGTEAGDPNFPEQGQETKPADPDTSKQDQEAKLVRISLWLKKICKNRPIPSYEVNETTVEILHDLMERCEERDRDVSLLIEGMKHQEALHDAETEEMQDVLKDLGLSPANLPRKAFKCLFRLAKSAVILETKDTSLTSLFCAIIDMTSEQFETRQKNKEMQRKLKIMKKKLSSALLLEKQLLEDIEKVEECQAKEHAKRECRSHNLPYLRDKSLELKIRIRNAEQELIDRGLERSLTHSALVEFSQELAPLEEKVVSLKKELQTYLDLPLSIPLAKVKVEEEKLELKALEDELSKELDKVPFELM